MMLAPTEYLTMVLICAIQIGLDKHLIIISVMSTTLVRIFFFFCFLKIAAALSVMFFSPLSSLRAVLGDFFSFQKMLG